MMRTYDKTARRRGAFTIIEILMVVSIIAILMSIAVVGIVKGRQAARRGVTVQRMQNIKMALTTYHNDHNAYPASFMTNAFGGSDDWEGGEVLTQSLIGYLPETAGGGEPYDNLDGPGFRLGATGRSYGPYMDLGDQATIARCSNFYNSSVDEVDKGEYWDPGQPTNINDHSFVFIDTWANAILYYRANVGGRTRALGPADPADERIWWSDSATPGDPHRFDTDDNEELIQVANGSSAAGEDVVDGYWAQIADPVDPQNPDPEYLKRRDLEQRLRTAKFMLLSAGPDGRFGKLDDGEPSDDDIIITGP